MAAMDTAEPSEILQCSFETKNGDVVEIVTTKQTWNEKMAFRVYAFRNKYVLWKTAKLDWWLS